jgi:hypothetical protein
LLAVPLTVTITLPVVAVAGTGTTILLELQLVGVADVLLKVTVLEPCVVPKLTPVIVTKAPAGPAVCERAVMVGPVPTTNGIPLLGVPPTVTTTFPVVAPLGTAATMLVGPQHVGQMVATTPLKVTLLDPCVVPKFTPVIVTDVPTAPNVGLKLRMAGPDPAPNCAQLLDCPPTTTIMHPAPAPTGTGTTMLVALQLVGIAALPLKVTELLSWVEPKFVPEIVTDVPADPEVRLRLVITGAGRVTAKFKGLLAIPPTVTTTLPDVAPLGTGTTMLVALQLVGVADVPLNVTVLVPFVDPKFTPVRVTTVPTGPEVGLKLAIPGPVPTVKMGPLLASPPTVTTTLPVVAPLGTGTTILVAPQLVGEAGVPLNETVLVPCVVPKLVPPIVTEAPMAPDNGLRLVIFGWTPTINRAPLLTSPPTVITTFPVAAPLGTGTTMLVALQLVGVADVPLNVTVLVPFVAPKFIPEIVTEVPTGPNPGDSMETIGTEATVKSTPLLEVPLTVTITFPVEAPEGTGTPMLVALQLVGAARTPLKVTVLAPGAEPKLEPEMTTAVPTGPAVGARPAMQGPDPTMNATPLLATPPTVATTFPVVAPVGTVATMLVAVHVVVVATVPLNVTVLVPLVAPKFVPVTVTDAPIAPHAGVKPVMEGPVTGLKIKQLLDCPLTVTTRQPAVAPEGTDTPMLVALQLVVVAAIPLNVTELCPWVVPKPVPIIVVAVPGGPDEGETDVMTGGGGPTVNTTPLLATPPTVTTTFPEVAPVGTCVTILDALQVVTVATLPLKVTVLVPWVAPKLAPEIVTDVPAAPVSGERPVTVGAGVVVVTTNATLLLARPPTVTTTFPVVAPLGTVTTIVVGPQFVGVAMVPLNVNRLVPCVAPKFVPAIVTRVPTGPEEGERLAMSGATDAVWYSSALVIATLPLPPAINTVPSRNKVALNSARPTFIDPVGVKVAVDGS